MKRRGTLWGRVGPSLLLLVTFAAVSGTVAGPRSSPAAGETYKVEAEEARQEGRLQDAIELYRKALELDPDWPEGWWLLTTLLYDEARYEEAYTAVQELIELWPHSGPAVALLGLCEYQLRYYEEAMANFQKSRLLGLADQPELFTVVRFHGAILLNRLEQYEAAYQALRDFAYQNVRSPAILDGFGLSVLRMPYLPDEIPSDRRELVRLAGRAAYEGEAANFEEADRLYAELVEKYSKEPNVHYAYGVFLMARRRDEGIEHFKKELEISPDSIPALLQIALEYINRGAFAEAEPFAQRALEVAPNSFAAHHVIGRILLETGQTEEAVRELEVARDLAPMHPETRFVLARAYRRAGREEDAAAERAEFQRLSEMKQEAEDTLKLGKP